MLSNAKLLAKLKEKITALSQQFTALAAKKIAEPCFDSQLFNYQGPLLNGYHPYLSELESNYQQFVVLIDKAEPNDCLPQVVYLAERITQQISALQRELSTRALRQTTKTPLAAPTLQEQYAKNLGYLNRLQAMKYQTQQALSQQPDQQAQQLAIIDQRIANCQHALRLIEQHMEQA